MQYDVSRFLEAHRKEYAKALKEIQSGRKQTHWMWFIFPQITGLGKSETSQYYEIKSLEEAKAYLENEELKKHLLEISTELLKLDTDNPVEVFGDIDALKLNSSMTLFSYVSTEEIFNQVIDKYFDGNKDEVTIKICQELEKKTQTFNKNMTFDNFVVGKSNKFAYHSCLAVAKDIGKILYNPLFVYGEEGVGKTHLLKAIENDITEKTDKKVVYVSSTQFMKDFLDSKTQEKENNTIKNKYYDADVLIMEDVQFLKGASNTQQELFHVFNSLYNTNKQIIISSSKAPDDLELNDDRLTSRFSWGLAVYIESPDIELGINFLKNYIKEEKLEIDMTDDMIEYIATKVTGNMRQLIGAITRIVAYSIMNNEKEITKDVVNEALKDYVK